jgi:hypothetical protein
MALSKKIFFHIPSLTERVTCELCPVRGKMPEKNAISTQTAQPGCRLCLDCFVPRNDGSFIRACAEYRI